MKIEDWAFKAYLQPSKAQSVAFAMCNCPKQFLRVPLGVTLTGWKLFHAALFRPCQVDTVQYIMCSSRSARNGLQAVFGLAVITSGNHNKAYIKLAWSAAIRCPNGFLQSWRGALCFLERPVRCSPARRGQRGGQRHHSQSP